MISAVSAAATFAIGVWLGDGEQPVVKAYRGGVGVLRADPMNGAFDFARGGGGRDGPFCR